MKVCLIHEEYADYANHEFESYLRLICSSEDNAKKMCQQLAEELAENSTNFAAYINGDSEGNPTVTLRHNNHTISEHHFTIEEWAVC